MAQFRKTKTFGGVRFSASKGGVGVSFGKGPLRIGVGADGRVRRTVRIPGTGIYDTKVIGRVQRHSSESEATPEDEEHPFVVEADDSPPCTRWQRAYVRQMLKGKAAEMPDLSELTIGQAEQILGAVGANRRALYRNGRTWGARKQQNDWLAKRPAE
ncbi:MAG: DUF4236 domain-containing protein [Actinomycetota bacterium]|jgi:hypothetical protein